MSAVLLLYRQCAIKGGWIQEDEPRCHCRGFRKKYCRHETSLITVHSFYIIVLDSVSCFFVCFQKALQFLFIASFVNQCLRNAYSMLGTISGTTDREAKKKKKKHRQKQVTLWNFHSNGTGVGVGRQIKNQKVSEINSIFGRDIV